MKSSTTHFFTSAYPHSNDQGRFVPSISGLSGYLMMRRLLETVIIEAFESKGIEGTMKNSPGDYLYLRDLITPIIAESSGTLSRNTKSAPPELKDLGDKSAHGRRYIAHRQDIETITSEFRGVFQACVFLANQK